uniref:Uncharacterized protein n=1 Tax=Megaselia scalaris TaxID=36166 RepID=T1H3D7_MEGSC
FPPVILHPFECKGNCARIPWKTILKQFTFNKQVKPVKWANPGYESACRMLYNFCETRLEYFADCRNNPPENYVSNLSPWFHFGHISCQRAILYIKQFQSKFPHSVDVFCEEAIVRRELADNFCFYNENYDNLSGISCKKWFNIPDFVKIYGGKVYEKDFVIF